MLLHLTDQLRFGLVCKSWLLVANKKPYPQAPEHPWLMTKRGNHKEPYEFLSLKDKRVNKMYKFPQHESIKGCSKGWLVTTKDRELHLLNPRSNVQFQLPHHFQFTYVPDLCKIKKVIMLHGPDTCCSAFLPGKFGNLQSRRADMERYLRFYKLWPYHILQGKVICNVYRSW